MVKLKFELELGNNKTKTLKTGMIASFPVVFRAPLAPLARSTLNFPLERWWTRWIARANLHLFAYCKKQNMKI